jgi:hypothetical protein
MSLCKKIGVKHDGLNIFLSLCLSQKITCACLEQEVVLPGGEADLKHFLDAAATFMNDK